MARLTFTNKELAIAALLTLTYLLTGFSLNPLVWPDQMMNRFALTETIQPDNPKIIELDQKFEAYLNANYESISLLLKTKNNFIIEIKAVEAFIDRIIPFTDDIANYITLDHRASVSDVLARGDDCDGIALVAASLLTRRGYDSYVVIGKWHSWVEVHLDENMIINILDSQLNEISPYYVKFNHDQIYYEALSYLEVILHNFLLILFLLKIGIITFTFIRSYDAFQSLYATVIALILSPIPVMLVLAAMNGI
ncbi:hypothetical protein [Candidatus Hodarchaeum mangrovi]